MTDQVVREFFDRRKLNKAAYDAAFIDYYSKVFMLAGAEELKDNFDFSTADLGDWVQGTLARMRALLIKDDEPAEENPEQ